MDDEWDSSYQKIDIHETTVNSKCQNFEKSKEDKEEALMEAQSTIIKLEKEVKSEKMANKSLQTELGKMKEELKDIEFKLAETKSEKELLTKEVKSEKMTNKYLQKELGKMKEELKGIEFEMAETKSEKELLTTNKTTFHKERDHDEPNRITDRVVFLRTQDLILDVDEKHNNCKECKVDQLKTCNERLQSKVFELEQEVIGLQQSISSQTSELHTCRKELVNSFKIESKVEEKCQQLQKQKCNLIRRFSELQISAGNSKRQNKMLRFHNRNLASELDILKAGLRKTRVKRSQLEKTLEIKDSKISEMESRNEHLTSCTLDLEHQVECMDKSKNVLQKDIMYSKQEKDKMENVNHLLKYHIESTEAKVRYLRKENKGLVDKDKVSTCKVQTETYNRKSNPCWLKML